MRRRRGVSLLDELAEVLPEEQATVSGREPGDECDGDQSGAV